MSGGCLCLTSTQPGEPFVYLCPGACDVFFQKHQYIGDGDRGDCYMRTPLGGCTSKTAKMAGLNTLKTKIEHELKKMEADL